MVGPADPSANPVCLAALARIVPHDDHPGLTDPALRAQLAALARTHHRTLWERSLTPGSAALEREAIARHGRGFAELDDRSADELLADLAAGAVVADWEGLDPVRVHDALVRVGIETYYGARGSPAWSMVGYDPSPTRDPAAEVLHTRLATVHLARSARAYDVVVVGAGAGGGAAAGVLAEAGLRVLLVERGAFLPFEQVGRDHLANQRLALHGHNAGPDADGNPRVQAGEGSGAEIVVDRPWAAAWSNNAMTVGGGSRVYQGMAWRLLPEDFRLASLYGVPEGSSLADWPIGYDDLEPFYTRAEWALGACGDGSSHRAQGPRSRPYPMPPFPLNPEGERLRRGAEVIGLSTGPVPLLINSEPRGGRAACVGCGECVGFACPSDAKNGSWNTFVVRALATGRCDLVTGARARRVGVDSAGRVDGVELVDWGTGGHRHVRAGHVVLAAGAIETARLLLASRSSHHPQGLGNATDQVGRHLQGHHYVSAFGIFDEPVIAMGGPGVTIATCDWSHDPRAGVIGGVVHNEVIKLPVLHWYWALPPDAARWGAPGKAAMRELYLRTSHLFGPVQEVPLAECRVTLADGVTDRHGDAVARLCGRYHPDTVRAADVQRRRAEQWLAASGAERTWVSPLPGPFEAGQHQAGTCRMGDDPASAVTDRWGRVHGQDNLWVMDGSLHVSNGGFGPVLTIYALALRAAEHLARTAR